MKVPLICIFMCFAYSSATIVRQCPNIARAIENLNDNVIVGTCKKPPCRLRKDTTIHVTLKLKPEFDVDKLVNTVSANILGIPFPFPGTDGTDACNDIYKDQKQVGCPLKAGEEYEYRHNIEVLAIYPRVKTVVHWGLTTPNKGDLICFEVPARITN